MTRTTSTVVVLRASKRNSHRAHIIARWVRTLLPTVLLVVTPFDATSAPTREDAIVLDADEVTLDPLSLVDTIARLASGTELARQ